MLSSELTLTYLSNDKMEFPDDLPTASRDLAMIVNGEI